MTKEQIATLKQIQTDLTKASDKVRNLRSKLIDKTRLSEYEVELLKELREIAKLIDKSL